MSKKILSLILSLVLVTSLLTGCGEKESTFFKEVKEISKISTGEGTVEMNMIFDAGDNDPKQLLNEEGKVAVGIKADVKQESEKKMAMKFSVKLGKATDYQDLTTIAVQDTKLYVDVAPAIELLKTFDEEAATEVKSSLSQIGVTDSISVDYKQLADAAGVEIPEEQKTDKELLEKVNNIFDKVEKDFESLQGKDGDDYTLSVNSKNADKAVDALATFFENDYDDIMTLCKDIVKKAYGEDNTISQTYEQMLGTTLSGADKAKDLKDSKQDIVKEIKESNINIVAKAKASGSEGKISLETGDITIEEDGVKQTGNVSLNVTVKETKASIDDMIPKNASDITTLVITMLNQMGQMNEGVSGNDGLDDMMKNQPDAGL
ncbi:hypothetical protein [uncultured Eubacterium sp.]|uniref:hypothetical protein n=1 Tax=uncultured Eubacterium sp. TaxID=165185 RepID=UPI00267272E1|nr:hypothetical protein [uncultured Eubacterium sp.]